MKRNSNECKSLMRWRSWEGNAELGRGNREGTKGLVNRWIKSCFRHIESISEKGAPLQHTEYRFYKKLCIVLYTICNIG